MESRPIFVTIVLLILTRVVTIRSSTETTEDFGNDYPVNDLYREEAFKKIEKILGIRGKINEDKRTDEPPRFMLELYNAVTDKDGAVIASNPYDARIVRSIREIGAQIDSSLSHFYFFNVSSLSANENLLEAELHLYLKSSRSSLGHSWPFYDIRVYQVLPEGSLNKPEVHKLLGVHHVDARALSGWHVLKVKKAVLSWLRNNEPNLGLLLTASSIDGDPIKLDFARRDGEATNDKLPLMVLFSDDATAEFRRHRQRNPSTNDTNDAKTNPDVTEALRHKRHEQQHSSSIRRPYARRSSGGSRGQPETMPDMDWADYKLVLFHRQKRRRGDGFISRDDSHDIVSRRKSVAQSLTSMNIYERAMTRELVLVKNSPTGQNSRQRSRRSSSSKEEKTIDCGSDKEQQQQQPCAKLDLWVDFYGIGLTSIIAPVGYEARRCAGHCRSPLSQEQKPTNHATIQSVIHKMNLAPEQRVDLPSCVPANLAGISILYQEEETGQVTLKNYDDMIVVSCGCR